MGIRFTYSTLRRGFAESRTEEYTRTVGCGGGGGGVMWRVLQNHAQKSIHARWDVGMEGGWNVEVWE